MFFKKYHYTWATSVLIWFRYFKMHPYLIWSYSSPTAMVSGSFISIWIIAGWLYSGNKCRKCSILLMHTWLGSVCVCVCVRVTAQDLSSRSVWTQSELLREAEWKQHVLFPHQRGSSHTESHCNRKWFCFLLDLMMQAGHGIKQCYFVIQVQIVFCFLEMMLNYWDVLSGPHKDMSRNVFVCVCTWLAA